MTALVVAALVWPVVVVPLGLGMGHLLRRADARGGLRAATVRRATPQVPFEVLRSTAPVTVPASCDGACLAS